MLVGVFASIQKIVELHLFCPTFPMTSAASFFDGPQRGTPIHPHTFADAFLLFFFLLAALSLDKKKMSKATLSRMPVQLNRFHTYTYIPTCRNFNMDREI